MVNILVDDLPAAVTIADTEYPIKTDWKTCLRTILAFEDNQLTSQEKTVILLNNMFPVLPRDNTQYVVMEAIRFLNGGEIHESTNAPRVYSFTKDANFIYAAFKQTHNIDLNNANLHWWQFLALFMDLGQDTTFCAIIGVRKRLANGTATKEEKKMAREMPDIFDLLEIDTRTLEEKEQERRFLELVEKARNEQKTKESQA